VYGSGVLIDFVGYPAKASVWQLVSMDILVGFLQLLTLTAAIARHEIRHPTNLARAQDHNAEERGVRRPMIGEGNGGEGGQDIEMRSFLNDAGVDVQQPNIHPLDRYYSGNMVILDLNILDIRRQIALEPRRRIDPVRMQAVFGTLLSRRFHAPPTS
jgi:hypothetical protein